MNQIVSRIMLPVVALSMGTLGFYHVAIESQTSEARLPPKAPAQTPYEDSVAAAGVIEPRTENIAIGAALSGIVLDVYVPSDRVGTRVTVGQPLFRVDDRHLKAQLKTAEAIVRTLPREQILAMKKQTVSLMPADLQKQLTAQDLVDIVEYLTTLKKQ